MKQNRTLKASFVSRIYQFLRTIRTLTRGYRPILCVCFPSNETTCSHAFLKHMTDVLRDAYGKDYHALVYTDNVDRVRIKIISDRNLTPKLTLAEVHKIMRKHAEITAPQTISPREETAKEPTATPPAHKGGRAPLRAV
jgi:hypothetical protein